MGLAPRPGAYPGQLPNEAGIPFWINMQGLGGETEVWSGCVAFTTRHYEPGHEPGSRGRIAESLWIGGAATLGLSARAGFNPAELADFLVGWFGWDMLQDDDWQPQPEDGNRGAKTGLDAVE